MNRSERRTARPRWPLVVAAATGAALLVLPAPATAADMVGTCHVQAAPDERGNILSFDKGTASNAQLRQDNRWAAGVTGFDTFVDRGDTSPPEDYVLRLRQSGNRTDVPCTTAPEPTCIVEDGEIRFDPGVFETVNLRTGDRWLANLSDTSAHPASGADDYVLRLELDSGFGTTDISCTPIAPAPSPAPAPAPVAPLECRYVISEESGTSFEFSSHPGSLNLRRDDRWLRNVTGMETASIETIDGASYSLVNHNAGVKTTVDCLDETPEPIVAPDPVDPPADDPVAPPADVPVPVADDCTISAQLVPSCGVWLGAATPTFGTNGTDPTGLAQYESVAHNTPDVLHFYKRNTQLFPAPWEIALANRPGQDQSSLLFYNWKPSTSHTWAQIADGKADGNIAAVAENLKNYPNKLWLAIYHEPEDNVDMSPGSGMTPADYVAMFRHTVQELEAHGVTNALYTWNLMGFERWWSMFEALYPGDDVVDWVCYDPYQQGRNTDLSLLMDGTSGFGTYSRLAAIAPDKPMCLGEWGVDVNLDNPVGFFDDTDPEAVLAQFPQMKLLMYWNNKHKGSYSLNTPTDKGRALAAGFAEFAANPIFNAMTPYAVPG